MGNTYHQDITLSDIEINYKIQNKKSIEEILKKILLKTLI